MMSTVRSTILVLCVLTLAVGCAGEKQRNQEELDRLRRIRERELGEDSQSAQAPVPSTPVPVSRQTEERPSWVTAGIAREYPLSHYITGIGSARLIDGQEHAAMVSADGRARGEIAKSIQVRITSEFQDDVELITQLREGKYATEKHRTNVAQQLVSVTDIVLEGVVISDRWFDAEKETWWSLAVMNRESAGQAIIDKLSHRADEMNADLAVAKEYDQRGFEYQAFAYHNAAMADLLALMNLRAQLRAVAPSMTHRAPAPKETVAAEIVKGVTDAGERLRLGVIVGATAPGLDVSPEPVRAEIERQLRQLGVKTVRVNCEGIGSPEDIRLKPAAALADCFGEEADAMLVAAFTAKEVARERMVNLDAHFWQARGDAVIVDLDTQQVVSSAGFDFLPATHTGSPNPQKAAEASLLKAAQEMMRRLAAELKAGLNLAE